MAYYFLFPEKDTTIYSHPRRTDLNTGKVETLCLDTEEGNDDDSYYPSRILIKFKDSEIKDTVNLINSNPGTFPPNLKTELKLYTTDYNQNLPVSQTIELYPLYDSWENGTQRYNDHPAYGGVISNGASWQYIDDGIDKTTWTPFGSVLAQNSAIPITSSYGDSSNHINGIGGTWYYGEGFESSQSISIIHDYDLNFDVTSQINKITASLFDPTDLDGIHNNGFIIKRANDITLNRGGTDKDLGSLKYFSSDTHTIFPPTLIFKWDDSIYPRFNPGQVTTIGKEKTQLVFTNIKKEYKQSEIPTFRIHVRPQYPDRKFTTSSLYTKSYVLPSTSYYSVEDYTSKEVIIPFDENNTKLSADEDGMYFRLYMQGLQPERYYRILIKSEIGSNINIYDENFYFKVIR